MKNPQRWILCFLLCALSACGTKPKQFTLNELDLLFQNARPVLENGKSFTGEVFANYPNGKTQVRYQAKDGFPEGKLEKWYPDGTRAIEATFRFDAKTRKSAEIGLSQRWDEAGVLVEEIRRDDLGRSVSRQQWCKPGSPEIHKDYVEGKPVLEQHWSCATGKQVSETRSDAEGQRHGEQGLWYPDGSVAFQGSFVHGQRDGTWATNYTNGQARTLQTFHVGVATGPFAAWSPSGNRVGYGDYAATGRRTGLWQLPANDHTLGDANTLASVPDLSLLTDLSDKTDALDFGPGGFVDTDYVVPFLTALREKSDQLDYFLSKKLVRATDRIALQDGSRTQFSARLQWPVRNWTWPILIANPVHVPALMAAGANINAQDSEGQTRLARCATYFNQSVWGNDLGTLQCNLSDLTALLEWKPDANLADYAGATPLHSLMKASGRVDMAMYNRPDAKQMDARAQATQLLLEHGATVDAADREGFTPLMQAIAARRPDLVRVLLSAGADLNLRNKAGHKPVHFTLLTSDKEIAFRDDAALRELLTVLAEHGANLAEPLKWNGTDTTLSQLAIQSSSLDLARWIDSLASSHPAKN